VDGAAALGGGMSAPEENALDVLHQRLLPYLKDPR
jgi:hypothetical protein